MSLQTVLSNIAVQPIIQKYFSVEGSCGPLTLYAASEMLAQGIQDFSICHRYGYKHDGIEKGHFFIQKSFLAIDFSAGQFGKSEVPFIVSLPVYVDMFPVAVNEYKINSFADLNAAKPHIISYLHKV